MKKIKLKFFENKYNALTKIIPGTLQGLLVELVHDSFLSIHRAPLQSGLLIQYHQSAFRKTNEHDFRTLQNI